MNYIQNAKLTICKMCFFASLCFHAGFSVATQAELQYSPSGTTVVGVTHLNVGGFGYHNLTFNDVWDPVYDTGDAAFAAAGSSALLDLLENTLDGDDWDTGVIPTAGCTYFGYCNMFTVHTAHVNGDLDGHRTSNDFLTSDADFASILGSIPSGNTFGTITYVNWSPVPVPGAIWLMGSGLLGLLGFFRKKKSQGVGVAA